MMGNEALAELSEKFMSDVECDISELRLLAHLQHMDLAAARAEKTQIARLIRPAFKREVEAEARAKALESLRDWISLEAVPNMSWDDAADDILDEIERRLAQPLDNPPPA